MWEVFLFTTGVAIAAMDTRDMSPGGGLDAAGFPVNNTDFLRISEEEIVFDHWNSTAENAKVMTCETAGGECMLKRTVKKKCNGKVDKKSKCDKRNYVCCISDQTTPAPVTCPTCEPCQTEECPYGEGFFSPPGSRQCFKFFREEINWTNAKEKCETEKPELVLAHPFDAVSLRSYLIQRFGWSFVWLNGRGDGSVVRWQDNNVEIRPNSPQWYGGYGSKFGTNYCLLQAGDWGTWKNGPTEPFISYPCSDAWPYLCELKLYY